jgi:hypothetical protein
MNTAGRWSPSRCVPRAYRQRAQPIQAGPAPRRERVRYTAARSVRRGLVGCSVQFKVGIGVTLRTGASHSASLLGRSCGPAAKNTNSSSSSGIGESSRRVPARTASTPPRRPSRARRRYRAGSRTRRTRNASAAPQTAGSPTAPAQQHPQHRRLQVVQPDPGRHPAEPVERGHGPVQE